MANIVISISEANLSVILNLISILFFIITIFFLSWIRKKVSENLNKTFVYAIIASASMIFIQLLLVFENLEIFGPFVYEAFFVIPVFFFLLGVISFYKSVVKEIKPPARRVHHRVHHRSVRKKR